MEPQEDSRQRRRGAVDTANSIISTATRIRKGAQVAGLIGANIWIIVGIVVGITLLTFIITLSGSSTAGIPEGVGEQTENGTKPIGGGTGGTSLALCSFTRSDQTPKEASFNSPQLLSYITQAANLVSMPPALLAAFIRVENPGAVSLNDSQLVSYRPRSETGALGLMQIQPPGTLGHDKPAVENGARLLGASYESLTEEDFFDPRKNIILGTGFILKKLSYFKKGDGTKWQQEWNNDLDTIRQLAKGYYGCHLYPSCSAGPHDYGGDLYTSLSACLVMPSGQPGQTAPAVSGDIREAIINRFGVRMDGFDNDHLIAIWEKLWETSNTNFPSLVRGSRIQAASGGWSSQVGCRGGEISVFLNQYNPMDFFKYIFTHELGHVIANCHSQAVSKKQEHVNSYASEGAISYYGANASKCTGSSNISEDYADMIAYYLNPQAGFSTSKCNGNAPVNPQNPFFGVAAAKQFHYNVARKVLEANF